MKNDIFLTIIWWKCSRIWKKNQTRIKTNQNKSYWCEWNSSNRKSKQGWSMPHRFCCIGQDVPGKLKLTFWWNSFYLSLFWTDWIKRQWECFINWYIYISEKCPFNDSKNVTKCHFNWYFWPSNTVFFIYICQKRDFVSWTTVSMIFLLDIARSKIFTRSRATQKLHFKPINSLEAAGAGILQPKNRCKDEKQHHLVAKIKSRIFFVEALGPLNNSTTVFGRYYYPVKSHFFGISTPKHIYFTFINGQNFYLNC